MSTTAPFTTLSSLLKRIGRHYPYLTVKAYTKEESLMDPVCPHLDVTFGETDLDLSFFDWTWVGMDDDHVIDDAVEAQTVSGAYKAFEQMLLLVGGKLENEDE